MIFICATNRPDELDLEFVRAGRIDRRLYIGLPDAKQRVQIFGVHSAGKQLAEDVDFRKVNLVSSFYTLLCILLTCVSMFPMHKMRKFVIIFGR